MSEDETLVAADQALRRSAVVGVPTDTVYGLAVDPRRGDACAAVFALKGRPERIALPVLVADLSSAAALVTVEARIALGQLAGEFWPGPLTVVVPARPGLGYSLGGDGVSIGLRCPDHRLARALLRRSGPLAVTSANRHGELPCTTARQVVETFGQNVAVVLDGGVCDGPSSSVVSLLGSRPELLRAGPIGLERIAEVLAGDAEGRRSGPHRDAP